MHGVLQSLPIVLPMMILDLDTLHSHRLCTLEWLHRRAASDWKVWVWLFFRFLTGHRSQVVVVGWNYCQRKWWSSNVTSEWYGVWKGQSLHDWVHYRDVWPNQTSLWSFRTELNKILQNLRIGAIAPWQWFGMVTWASSFFIISKFIRSIKHLHLLNTLNWDTSLNMQINEQKILSFHWQYRGHNGVRPSCVFRSA